MLVNKENGRRSDSNRSPEGNQVNVVESRSEEMLSLEDSSSGDVLYNAQHTWTWLLDFGVPFHATPDIAWFSDYSIGADGTVRLGIGQKCIIVGIGEVPIQLLNDNSITLHQVRHVPELNKSLVSIGMLAKVWYRLTLSELSWMINQGNRKIRCRCKYNNLYPLMAINPEGIVKVHGSRDSNL